MNPHLKQLVLRSLVVGTLLFVALLAADRLVPGLFETRVEWWLLPILILAYAGARLAVLGLTRAGRRKDRDA